MQNGGDRLKGKIDEIDEYLKDPIDTDNTLDTYETAEPAAFGHDYDENDREEIRRLTALVAHLRDQVSEMKSQPEPRDIRHQSRSTFPFSAFSAVVGVGLIGLVCALHARTFDRP